MTVPNNQLQNVQTYQMSELALLQNENCFVSIANKKYNEFNKLPAQLGSTVTFDLPPRVTSVRSLQAQFQPANQRLQSLTVNNEYSASIAFTSEQEIFNAEQYMSRWGKSLVAELGSQIESDVATLCATAPYRFYGNGSTPINSYLQLAQMVANFENYGSCKNEMKCVLQDTAIPAIVNSGQNQFTPDRNNKSANSWELGEFSRTMWYKSNLLPVHNAGTIGNGSLLLTVTGVNTDQTGAVVSIEANTPADLNDPNAIMLNDRIQFVDGVSGFPNMRFLTFIGYLPSTQPVQVRATANCATDGSGNITIPIYPPLQQLSTNQANINNPILPGMKLEVMPSHRAGMMTSGKSLYLAMPKLPNQSPFTTVSTSDPETGVSLRHTEGAAFGQNQLGTVIDAISGYTQVPEYSMAILFPV